MCDFALDQPLYKGGKFRLIAVEGDCSVVVFESKNPHIVTTLADGIAGLIDLAREIDS